MTLQKRIESVKYWLSEIEAGHCGYLLFGERVLDDVPALIAEVERLQELVEAQKALIREHEERWSHVVREHGVAIGGHYKAVQDARARFAELGGGDV